MQKQYVATLRGRWRPSPDAVLTRRSEQDGDKASGRGGHGRRGSSSSIVEGTSRMGIQQQGGPPSSISQSSSMGASTPASNPDVPPTPTLQTASPVQQRGSGAGAASQPAISPSARNYGSGGGYTDYVTDPRQQSSLGYPSAGLNAPAPTGSSGEYGVPRTPGHVPLFVVTQGLSPILQPVDSNPPDLSHIDASPWGSSDSSYSTTPATDHARNQQRYGPWIPGQGSPTADWQQNMLFPNAPPAGVRDASGLDALATPYFFSPLPPSQLVPQQPGHHHTTFGYLDVPVQGFPDSHGMMGGRSHSSHLSSLSPLSSVRSPSPVTTSTASAETLVTPSTALPADRLGLLAGLGRRKELSAEDGMGPYGGTMAFAGGLGSPGGVPGAHGLGGGCGGGLGFGGIAMSIPLNNTVRKAIPGYLEVYWTRFHPSYPIVHRPSFEAAPEDVLRCAMAAAATQFLDAREDRQRGNQLHEYAWQEAKRVSFFPSRELEVGRANRTRSSVSTVEPPNHAGHPHLRVLRALPRAQGGHQALEDV